MTFRSMKYAKLNFEVRDHTIYRLCDPRPAKTVRYVGRTSLQIWYERLEFHVENAIWARPSPTSRLGCWIVALRVAGLDDPEIEDIETVAHFDAFEREAHWIEHHRAAGDPLLNANSGDVKPRAWNLPPLTFEEREARCADPDYDLKQRR